jgi:hypothetical protein
VRRVLRRLFAGFAARSWETGAKALSEFVESNGAAPGHSLTVATVARAASPEDHLGSDG